MGGPAPDQDNVIFNSADAAEPLTKKRVAFKDDLVDAAGADIGLSRSLSPPEARRCVSTPQTTPQDDLATAPAGDSPARVNRFGTRGRPGSAGNLGRRPLVR